MLLLQCPFFLCRGCNALPQCWICPLCYPNGTAEEEKHFVSHREESGKGRGLMVWPFEFLDPALKKVIVICPTANIEDQIISIVVVAQIIGYILYFVPISLFQEVGGRECHGNDPFGYVGKVKVQSFVLGSPLGARNNLPYQFEHCIINRYYNRFYISSSHLYNFNNYSPSPLPPLPFSKPTETPYFISYAYYNNNPNQIKPMIEHQDKNHSTAEDPPNNVEPSPKDTWQKRVENIIYNIYIQQKSTDSPKLIPNKVKEEHQQKKQGLPVNLWEQLRKEFAISMAATINQLYTNQQLITHIIHYLSGLPFTDNSKKIIRNIVQYYDPSRIFIKSLIQTLVPNLERQQDSQLNKIHVILFTLNVLFNQQSPENPKFNSYIYLFGGEGLKVESKVRWPFEKSGTICMWYNMSDETKQCKLFQIVSPQKTGYEIVLRNKKIYFEKIKEQKGFSLIRNDSAFLCEALTNTDVKLWIEFEIKKKYFQKALFINVIMNNFVLSNIEVDYFNPTSNEYNITFFKHFHGKISSVLIFTQNLAKEVQNLGAKQGFTYENDIKNFSYMFDNILSHVYLLYTSIRSRTYYSHQQQSELQDKQDDNPQIFKQKPVKTVVFDAINRRNGIIGPEACTYHNISIQKKEMVLYGGLQTYIGFLQLLKFHAKMVKKNVYVYTQVLGELIILFKNIFESKATSVEEADSVDLFRIMSNFFIETEMVGFSEELTPKLKQLYVSLNNRCTKQKFFKKFFWGIPAGEYLELSDLQYYIRLVKGIYTEQIQNSLNIFGVKDIIKFLLDKYDNINCCFEHKRTNSIETRKKIKSYQEVLAKYFEIIQQIIEIKMLESLDHHEVMPIIEQITSCFALNTSPCFVEALVTFLSDTFAKNDAVETLFLQQFQNTKQSKMGLFSALANSYSWRTKGNLIELILHIYGVKMFREGGEKDLMALCIRYPTLVSRFSSVKSQDIQRSIDVSQDKISLNSTNVRSLMAMRPICMEELVLLSDQEIIRIIWEWGTCKSIMQSAQDNQNPATLILMDLYKGSTYKIRKMIGLLFLNNIELILFTPDFMAWVIECLLIGQFDSSKAVNSDQILFVTIEQTKKSLLSLISTYRVTNQQGEQSLENELDIIKLILISVKSKYTHQISNYYNLVFLLISEELIANFYEQIKKKKFESQEEFIEKSKTIFSNCFKCLLEYFISKNNDDFQFQEQSEMQSNEKQFALMLSIIQKIYDILIYLTANQTLIMDESNAKRNQIMFELLFIEQGKGSQIQLLCFIFVCLQGLFDNYDEVTNEKNYAKNISKKKTILTLIKKYLKYVIEISENSGGLKIQKFEQTLSNIFLNALGFLQSKFYQYHFGDGIQFQNGLRNIEDIKNLIVNIFVQLIELMKYIEECGCSKHKSFYELMKPKKKHKNITSIKNLFPIIWKKVDDKIFEFYHLKNEVLREEQAKNKLQEHLKMKRLYSHTMSIEKAITKKIDKFLQKQKKINEITEKKSVLSYTRNESQKYKILADFQESIALFMFQNSNKQRNEEQQRKIENQYIRRNVQQQLHQIWNRNRIYQGFWTNHLFYSYSQNNDTFLYDNTLNTHYKRIRSDRQTKYLLTPIVSIVARQPEEHEQSIFDEEVFLAELPEEGGEKLSERKSEKYLQVGFQFLKKKVIEKIKKSANLMKEKAEEKEERKMELLIFREVLLIEPMKVRMGTLRLDNNYLQFQFRPSTHLQHISLLKNRQKQSDSLSFRLSLQQIECFQLKKYMLKLNSIEIFLKTKNSIFLSFYGRSEQHFNKFAQMLQMYKKIESLEKISAPLRILDPWKSQEKYAITDQWIRREISTFSYILSLNILSGRTNCDLNQYFILPWILSDYKSAKFKKDQYKYRDLQKNMGSLGNGERIQKFIEIKNTIEENHKEQFVQSHFFGFHYSNLPIVLQYLIRVSPYAEGAMQLQGGKFDIPDRLFTSISDSFRNATTQMSDVRQLIPEFYYFPQFLINCEDFDFGVQQNSKRVNNVQLPDGYSNAYDFIEAHRQQLQSEQISNNIHKWIDLIFGYKQYGKQAELSYNKFHYLSYESNAHSIFHEDKLQNRESIESQIAYFGKVPSQLFTKPHPKRNPLLANGISQYTMAYTRANPFINEEPISGSLQSEMIKHEGGAFSKPSEVCIHFNYCEQNKKYLILRRDGKGVIFQNDKADKTRNLSISMPFHFQMFFDKFEQVYIFDETVDFDEFAICSLWSEHLFFGGLWGGKILKYDIITKQFEVHSKHSDTVTAIGGSEELQMLVSGTISGEIVIWEYITKSGNSSPPNAHTPRKLIYKFKVVTHYARINSVNIHNDLRAAVVSSEDGSMSLIDVQRFQVMRIIKIGVAIKNALLLSYPYYMFFILCANDRQLCYSINGQYLDESNYENLHNSIRVCTVNGYQERVVVKKNGENCFSLLKLPELREVTTFPIKAEDNSVLEYLVNAANSDIEILFNTRTHLVYCNSTLETNRHAKRTSSKKQ